MSNIYEEVLEDIELLDKKSVISALDRKTYSQRIMDEEIAIEDIWENDLEE